MTLESSGILSIGGSTVGRSINLEVGRSPTAQSNLNETTLRDLAGVSSGTISISDFYGKTTPYWIVTITNGTATVFGFTFNGYGSIPVPATTWGSATDTSCDLYSTNPDWAFYHVGNGDTIFYVRDGSGTPTGNAGWTSVEIYLGKQYTDGDPDYTRNRADLTYSAPNSATRTWNMDDTIGGENGVFSDPDKYTYTTLVFKP